MQGFLSYIISDFSGKRAVEEDDGDPFGDEHGIDAAHDKKGWLEL
jgi:hypothetical protein